MPLGGRRRAWGRPSRRTSTAASLALAVTIAALPAVAADGVGAALPPWSEVPLPAGAKSARVIDGEQSIFAGPSDEAARRGTAALGARLPIFGARSGAGCRGSWLHVGPSAWLCQDRVELRADMPVAVGHPAFLPRADGLPFRYYFAGPSGSLAYRRLAEVDRAAPAFELDPGFAVAVVEERLLGGQRYGLTRRDLWVPLVDFAPARPLAFRGEPIAEALDGELPFAWVVVERARLYRRSGNSFVPTGESRLRFERVGFFERVKSFAGDYARIDDERWIRAADVRHPTLAAPPDEDEIARGGRWIDIELASQTLVAYEGARPVFATLVSTGRGLRPGHPSETPKGVHRVWVKLVSTTMDNLEDERASRYYRIEDVPYVQFFSKGVGLHAAFWHRSLGHVRSHGCVNLSPHDAAYLFDFTGPRVPAGWTAALPTRHDPGTIIRVR